jgi:hypothetical protein
MNYTQSKLVFLTKIALFSFGKVLNFAEAQNQLF